MNSGTDLWGRVREADPEDKESPVAKLHKARFLKDDEFYTQYADIAKELQHYEHHFAGKVVYCPCDDPAWSKFVEYFTDNYDRLGLAGLETNHLRPDGTGDFRSREALAKLERADIVVTNPPFSIFRQFMATLMDSNPDRVSLIESAEPNRNKKFLIMGAMTSFSYSTIIPALKNNTIWAGVNNGKMDFTKPDGTIQSLGNVAWFTNLDHPARIELLNQKGFDCTHPFLWSSFIEFPCNHTGLDLDNAEKAIFDVLNQLGLVPDDRYQCKKAMEWVAGEDFIIHITREPLAKWLLIKKYKTKATIKKLALGYPVPIRAGTD